MKHYKVEPGSKVILKKWDANDTEAFPDGKKAASEKLEKTKKRLMELQELLYAEHKHKILIVLQGMDTAGKDGTIRHVFEGVNPQGVSVASFKKPTQEELDHDYLWRVHKCVPAKGQIVIFNRSHYEDVLAVRVHELVPQKVWEKRYAQINSFEKMLVEEGTTILKFYLNIDEDEQKNRLQARIDKPDKHWKLSVNDIPERKLWPVYMDAYEDMLSKTSTEHAPWHVIPSNRKWYRNLIVCSALVYVLEKLNMSYPKPAADFSNIKVE